MNRTRNAKRNIIWGILHKFVSIVLPFFSRTAMIYVLGIEYVGLNSLFASILSMLSLAELGIGSALVFSMYKPIAENDTDKICALLSFYHKCYLAIGMLILGIGLSLMPFLEYLIEGSVPPDVNLYLIYAIYLLNNCAGYFLFAYKQSVLIASQRVDIVSKIQMATGLLSNAIQIVMLLVFRNYYAFLLVLPTFTIINNLITAYLSKRYYPQYVCKGKIEKEEIKSIKGKVGGLLFQRIGNIVLANVDPVVISAFLGLQVLGIYNGYLYVINALFGFLTVIHSSIIPLVGNSIVTEDIEKNYHDFQMFHFLYLWIVSWFDICMIVFYQPFMSLWQGADNLLGMDMVILFGLYFFAYKMGDMSYVYKEAIGLWWEGRMVPLISSVVNLTMNIVLVKTIGLPGIVLSTFLSATIVNTPFGSRVLFKYYFKSRKNWIKFLRETLFWLIRLVIAAVLTFFITGNHGIVGFPGFFVNAIICIVVPNIVFFILSFKNASFISAYTFIKRIV